LTLTVSGSLAQETREPVELSLLTYNVHGLHEWLVDDDPPARMPRISALLDAYDVVLIQEDWSYHELLTQHVEHEVIERGNSSHRTLAAVLPFLFSGSGLTALAREREQLVSASRDHFGHCAGWLGGGMDCYASKGFLQLRLRLANGAELESTTSTWTREAAWTTRSRASLSSPGCGSTSRGSRTIERSSSPATSI
jgi:hypothetical protein